eukprot:COSAG01_NODE_48581_length_379_cov_16.696429_1_plen_37_part_01
MFTFGTVLLLTHTKARMQMSQPFSNGVCHGGVPQCGS